MFDPFGDYETKGYLRNKAGEKDPERVKRLEHACFRVSIGEAIAYLQERKILRYSDIKKHIKFCLRIFTVPKMTNNCNFG